MASRSMADAVRAILVKRAFVPGDPGAGGAGGGMPSGGDPGAVPPGGDPGAMPPGAMPPGADPSMMGGMPPGGDPMAGMPPPGMDPSMMGGMPQTGMINMTADEFTKFVKQMMAAFGQGGAAPAQQSQSDLSAKLDTLIAVIQGKAAQPAAPAAQPAVIAGA